MDYSQEYTDKNPDMHVHHSKHKVRQIMEVLPPKKFDRILDIACGAGAVTRKLADKLGPEYMEGLDVSQHMLDAATAADTQSKVTWTQSDIREYSPAQRFDLLVCSDIIEHVDDDAAFLRSLHALGDAVVLRVPLEDSWAASVLRKYGIFDLWENNKAQYGHIHYYNAESIMCLIEDNGFVIKAYKYKTWLPLEFALYPLVQVTQKFMTQNLGGFMVLYLERAR